MAIQALSAAVPAPETALAKPVAPTSVPQSRTETKDSVKVTDDAVIVGISNRTVSIGEDGSKSITFSKSVTKTDAEGNVYTKVLAGSVNRDANGDVVKDGLAVKSASLVQDDGSYENYTNYKVIG